MRRPFRALPVPWESPANPPFARHTLMGDFRAESRPLGQTEAAQLFYQRINQPGLAMPGGGAAIAVAGRP